MTEIEYLNQQLREWQERYMSLLKTVGDIALAQPRTIVIQSDDARFFRNAALEEAAGVCETTLAQHYMKQATPAHDEALLLAACADCAAAIRARLEGKA